MSATNDKRIQLNTYMETYAYGKSDDLVCKKNSHKCNIVIKQYKKRLFLITSQRETLKKTLKIGHKFQIIDTEYSRSGKTNDLYNIIDKIYLYAKDPYEVKYQFLINKLKAVD